MTEYLYRLYLGIPENTEYAEVFNWLAKKIPDAFTSIYARGSWHGIAENSVILEVIGHEPWGEALRKLAELYKAEFKQEAVYFTRQQLDKAELI